MGHTVIGLAVQPLEVIGVDGEIEKIELPNGCIGVCYVFESKKAARAYYGKDVKLLRVKGKEKDG